MNVEFLLVKDVNIKVNIWEANMAVDFMAGRAFEKDVKSYALKTLNDWG